MYRNIVIHSSRPIFVHGDNARNLMVRPSLARRNTNSSSPPSLRKAQSGSESGSDANW